MKCFPAFISINLAIIAEKIPRADYTVKCSCIKKGTSFNVININYEGRSINNITNRITKSTEFN